MAFAVVLKENSGARPPTGIGCICGWLEVEMNRNSGKSYSRVPRRWLVVLLVIIGLPMGLTTARQVVNDQVSPATGHAQVTTQGISDLPTGDVVWRVVERTAKPRDEAQPGKRVLSFILATEEPVLLTNLTVSGKPED